MWRSDRPARAHPAGCIPSSRLACRVSRCFFPTAGHKKAPCGMTTPLNELPRSRKPAHVGFRRRGCHEAASQCQEACPGGLRAGTSDDACAAPPSNRSEVCAGMRQYMKCRRPVWRHVKTGGEVCVGRSCDGLLRVACGLATVHSTEKGLPFYIRFI